MTYRPAETSFAPPFVVLVPSFIYLSLALVAIGVVIAAHVGPTNSNLHIWIVEQDPRRVIGSRTFATLIAASALSVLLRASMRGVRIRPDGIEYRDVLLGWPRIRRYRWPQIDRIILDQPRSIVLDLWDGTHALLPEVGDRAGLSMALEKVAHARAIPVRGGKGVDEIPESDELADEEG
ncbi:MAG: hypothetical protein HS104_29545 [Polyangiaceae bacterium]|nr:hypothetical protein [Polyangiaceae bacterium]MCE7892825.1 hypothetical protein [Sorangiineae bacterium PRO1]MCL4753070.1 hypothetical protein [Myxococcales bacterium]